MATVDVLLSDAIARLRSAGSETPRLDAELLLAYVLGQDRTAIVAHPDVEVGASAAERFERAVVRREAGEPVAYVRGMKEFHGLALATDERALIPRPETETLVDLAIAEIARRLVATARPPGTPPIRIADVGTGAGAIAVALAVALRRRRMIDDVELVASDVSPEALELAKENAVGHAVGDVIAFEERDLLPTVVGGRFDLVLANLPYVRSDAIAGLPVAASFEPRLALDGGADGLDVIRRLLEQLPSGLQRGGVALLEIGGDQEREMLATVGDALPGWPCTIEKDLGGLPRVARIERPE
jgi:release factor glutamine methyltransferase